MVSMKSILLFTAIILTKILGFNTPVVRTVSLLRRHRHSKIQLLKTTILTEKHEQLLEDAYELDINNNNESNIHGSKQIHALSLVIPAFNEELRLPKMLDETLTFLHHEQYRRKTLELAQQAHFLSHCTSSENNDGTKDKQSKQIPTSKLSFEIIVVDDGSTDGTSDVVQKYAKSLELQYYASDFNCDTSDDAAKNKNKNKNRKDTVRLVQMKQNSGKGAAVQQGMLRSHSNLCLMVDADGATEIEALIVLLEEMVCLLKKQQNQRSKLFLEDDKKYCNDEGPSIINTYIPAMVIGSRSGTDTDKKSLSRMITTNGFQFCVKIFFFLSSQRDNTNAIQDTQCGFKLFNKPAANIIFSNLHLKQWAFDVEVIDLALQLSIPISEVNVKWREVDGSKLNTSKFALVKTSLEMLRDMAIIRICYSLGLWKIDS